MADKFKGLDKETLASALEIKNSMKDIGMATQDLNKRLQRTNSILVDVGSEFNKISKAANTVADLQEKAKRSSTATKDAFTEQIKQLNIVKTLNIQIDNLYRASKVTSGQFAAENKANLELQAKNLSAARDNAQALANDFKSIAESSAELSNSTLIFSTLAEVASSAKGLKTFAVPFEAAAEASRKQVLENAKSLSIKERLKDLTEEELTTGKGLTKQRIQDLGLQDIVGKRAGSSAANLLKTAQATAKTQSVGIAGLSAGFKALGPIISKVLGPVGLILKLVDIFNFFKDAMFEADKRVTGIAKNLSVSKDVARAIYRSFIDSKSVLTAQLSTTKNIVEAFNELSDFSNFINLATTKQLDTQIILTKEIGVSKEAALGFQSTLAVSNIEADKGLSIVYDQIAAFANQNKIVANGRKIFEEINKTSKLTQLNFRGGFESLVKTTLQANKLGLTLDQVSKVGSSLLNFEQSISSELEAELLTGKNINLEKARLFALNHDIAGLTQEIANQGITAEKFTAMNVIQQEAIAKALGMQASELGEALYNQKLIEQTAGNVTKDLRARAIEEGKLGHLQEERLLMQRAEGIEKGLIQGKDIEAAQRSLDIQTQFDNALEQAKEIFSDFVDGEALSNFAKVLTSFVKSVQTKGLFLTLTTGISDSAQLEAQAMFSNEGENKPYGDSSQPPIIQTPTIVTTQPLIAPNTTTKTTTINTVSDPLEAKAAETNKLLTELISQVKQGGNVYIDSKMAGTATAQGTYRL
jgi:hypothetical protein